MAASIVLAVVLCTSLGVVFWPRVATALGVKPAPPPPAYAAGERVDVPAAWYARRPKTLIVFARASCGACQKAQPFLKTLVGFGDGSAAAAWRSPATASHRPRTT